LGVHLTLRSFPTRRSSDLEPVGKVLKGNGRNDGELYRALPIISLCQRVLNKGFKFTLKVFQTLFPSERFVVSEKSNNDVGFKSREPLIRRFKMALAAGRMRQFRLKFFCAGKCPWRKIG